MHTDSQGFFSTEKPVGSSASTLQAILGSLAHGIRKHFCWVWLIRSTLVLSASWGLTCILATKLSGPWLIAGLLWIPLFFLLLLAGWAFRAIYLASRPYQLTLQAEKIDPALGSSLSTALALLHGHDASTSHGLAEAHITTTVRALTTHNLPQHIALHFTKKRKVWKNYAVAACVVVSCLAAFRMETLKQRIETWARLGSTITVHPGLLNNITVTYHYPAYTQLSARVVPGSNGTLQAVRGTEAHVRLASIKKAQSANAVIRTQTDETITLPMEIHDANTLSIKIPMLQSGSYRIEIVDAEDEHIGDGREYTITADPDLPPNIRAWLPEPKATVRDLDTISVAWQASDDYGLSEVRLVVEGGTEPIPIWKNLQAVTLQKEDFFPVAVAQLRQGRDEDADIRFYLEALDNNARDGIATVRSETMTLSVFSASRVHQKVLADQRAIIDALVDWLDVEMRTEDPSVLPKPTPDERIKPLAEAVKNTHAVLEALSEDTLSQAGLHNAIAALHARLTTQQKTHKEQSITGQIPAIGPKKKKQLENDILYFDDLFASQRIDDLRHTADELLSAQQKLQTMLAEYRNTGDKQLREKIEQRIHALKQEMIGLLQRMANIRQTLPDGYRNAEAATGTQVGRKLKNLEDMLASGSFDDAARELEELASLVENMARQLDNTQKQFGDERYEAARGDMEKLSQEFEALSEEQKSIAGSSQKIREANTKQALEKNGFNEKSFREKAKKLLAEATQQIETMVENSSFDIQPLTQIREEALELDLKINSESPSKIFPFADQFAQVVQLNAQRAQGRAERFTDDHLAKQANKLFIKASDRANALRKLFDDLLKKENNALSEEQKSKLEQLAKEQADVSSKADKLQQKMGNLAEKIPSLQGEPSEALEQATKTMREAAQSFAEKKVAPAASQSARASAQLQQLREALSQASKGSGSGVPLPMGRPEQRQREGQGGGFKSEPVALPGNTSREEEARFRQRLLEAAKLAPPTRYQDAVKNYYKELVQ